ncbi:MAG: DNA polymerase III subunit delta [Spirochaetia bacterium]|jgi:DNA polymerase-3 subunit delta|nr:DNA polymerase III subunit delta [Spirochaetia bacterium]
MSQRVYLLLGPEAGEKAERVWQIKNQLTKELKLQPQVYKFYPFEGKDNELYIELNNIDLFSPHSLVILSQAETMNEQQAKDLLAYVQAPSPSSTLIILSDETKLPSATMTRIQNQIKQQFPPESFAVFWELKEEQLAGWVNTFFAQQGLLIDQPATELLLDLVDNNTMELKVTCRQLAFFWQVNEKGNSITENDIETYVHHTREENAFTLFAAMASGSLSEAIGIADVILERSNNAQYTLIGGLIWCWRRLQSIAEQLETGSNQREAFQEATVLGKRSSIRRPSDFKIYTAALNRYDAAACRRILALLFSADVILRKETGDLQKLELEKLVIDIMVNKGKKIPELRGATFAVL